MLVDIVDIVVDVIKFFLLGDTNTKNKHTNVSCMHILNILFLLELAAVTVLKTIIV